MSFFKRHWKWWVLPPLLIFGILLLFLVFTDKSFILPAIYALF